MIRPAQKVVDSIWKTKSINGGQERVILADREAVREACAKAVYRTMPFHHSVASKQIRDAVEAIRALDITGDPTPKPGDPKEPR